MESTTPLLMTQVLECIPDARHHSFVCSTGAKGYHALKEMVLSGKPGNTLLIESVDPREMGVDDDTPDSPPCSPASSPSIPSTPSERSAGSYGCCDYDEYSQGGYDEYQEDEHHSDEEENKEDKENNN